MEYSNIYYTEWGSFFISSSLLLELLAFQHVSVLAQLSAHLRMVLGVLKNVLKLYGPVSVRLPQHRKSVLRWQSMLTGINASVWCFLLTGEFIEEFGVWLADRFEE